MRTVVLTDCHVGSDESNYRDVKRFLSGLRCDELVLGGDFWDLWEESPRRLRERHGDVIALLARAKLRGARLTYVLGNHDAAYREDPVMPAGLAEVVDGPYLLPGHPRRVIVIHGHEHDPRNPCLCRWLSWANGLSASAIGVSMKTFHEATSRDSDEGFPDYARENQAAARAAYSGKCDCLVIGHTHYPVRKPGAGTAPELIDAGDWKWSNTWAEVVDGAATLNEFARERV